MYKGKYFFKLGKQTEDVSLWLKSLNGRQALSEKIVIQFEIEIFTWIKIEIHKIFSSV